MSDVKESVYQSAVRGRQEFRKAYREQKSRADKFALALMMIREGAGDPRAFAAKILADSEKESTK